MAPTNASRGPLITCNRIYRVTHVDSLVHFPRFPLGDEMSVCAKSSPLKRQTPSMRAQARHGPTVDYVTTLTIKLNTIKRNVERQI